MSKHTVYQSGLDAIFLEELFSGAYLRVRECISVEDFDIKGGKLIETNDLDWLRNLEEILLEPIINV